MTKANLAGLAELDRMIHEPSRLVIIVVLGTVESADFLYLLRETGLTKGNLSAHLSKLEQSGYITIEKTFEGKISRTNCKITDSGQRAFEGYLDIMSTVLPHNRA